MSVEATALKLLIDRLDQQDGVLQSILSEARRTNGRVSALETSQAISQDREQRQVRKSDLNRKWRELLIGGLCVIVGGVIPQLLHILHLL